MGESHSSDRSNIERPGSRRRTRRSVVWPPKGSVVSVRDGDVGTLFLLRNAGAARSVHGQLSVETGNRSRRMGPRGVEAGTRSGIRTAWHPAAGIADLWALHRPRLSDPDIRRNSRRPMDRPNPNRHPWRDADGRRPFHDGLRAPFPVRAGASHSGQRRFQAEYFDAGWIFMHPTICAETALIRFSTSESTSVRSFHRWSAVLSAKTSVGTTALPARALGWRSGLRLTWPAFPACPNNSFKIRLSKPGNRRIRT